MPMLMRVELARPGQQILSNEHYNQLFTTHGTIMLLSFGVAGVSAVGLPLGWPGRVGVRRHGEDGPVEG
jgi:cytochrome c oxidase subunit 1